VAHLEQLDQLYGPIPGRPTKPAVLVEDNGPIHVSKLARAAIEPPGTSPLCAAGGGSSANSGARKAGRVRVNFATPGG
jgi:hypothetical protein